MGTIKSNVLITGATGFLGSYLTKELIQYNYCPIVLKRSFDDTKNIETVLHNVLYYDIDKVDISKIFSENKIDIIIHTATNYGRGDESLHDIIDCNIEFPLRILDFGIKNSVDTFINTDTVLNKFTNEYSLSKKQFLEWLIHYSEKIQVINIKLEHMYGPGDSEIKFVTKMIKQMLNNDEKIDLTNGEQKRDFIYIEDVVSAYIAIIEKLSELTDLFYEFDVGSGNVCTIKDLALLIHELTGTKSSINFGVIPYRKDEVMESKADLKNIKGIGWSPKTLIKDGLIATIEYERQKNG